MSLDVPDWHNTAPDDIARGTLLRLPSWHGLGVSRSPYAVVGVSRDASTDQIKKAYREKVLKLHPDHPGGDADAFRELQEAYEVLMDSTKRAALDRASASGLLRGTDVYDVVKVPLPIAVVGGSAAYLSYSVAVPPGVVDGDQLRLSGLGGPGIPRGDLILTVQIQPHERYRLEGHDIHAELPVTWFEAYAGASVPVATPWRRIAVDIPPGTPHGDTIVVPGDGMRSDGAAGDMVLSVRLVAPPPGDDTLVGVLLRLQRLELVRGTMGDVFD